MSGLRARLNAIGGADKPAPPPRPGGVQCHRTRFDVDEGVYALTSSALRRMGWQGGHFSAERTLFLDTETTGLSGGAGTVAFLVGLGFIRDGAFWVEQFCMRDYSDEPEMLALVSDRMREFDACVTYNGRTFDMPLLQARYTMCRMADRFVDMDQLDLLHAARKVWKLRLGRCRLCDLEERILGHPREADLPGSEAPRRYFEYLRTGNESLLEDVILHNRQDIVSLMSILAKLGGVFDRPEEQTSRQDLFSLGKALERQGELRNARELYRLSAVPPSVGLASDFSDRSIAGMANWRHYHILRRNGDWESAQELLRQMIRRRQMNELPYIELAKIAEHRIGDLSAALMYTEQAMEVCPEERMEDLARRRERIKIKIASSGGTDHGNT